MPTADLDAAAGEEPARVLLVDDEPANLDLLRQALDGRGYRLLVATSGEDALKVAHRSRPSLVLLDVVMPGIDGYETCRRLKADPETKGAAVIFLSALAEAREKVRGLEAGAVDFVTKPFQPEEVVARVHTHLTVQRLQAQLESRNAELARELQVAEELLADARRRVEGALLGSSPAVRALRETIAQRASSVEPLLLTGPPGAGQEAVARAVHHQSPRGRQAFIHVNCALLAPGQAQGLLGGAGGSDAAGAACTLGPLELAERGTLYLEEIHQLPPELQVRLAELLEAASRARAAGGAPVPEARVIASTSAPTSVESGLRPRLLAALEVGTLRVPSLAERAEDIPELARFFVGQHARRAGAVVERLSDESERRLRAYRWPGNLRELESVLERAVLSAREPVLEVDKALLDEGLPLGHYRLMTKLGEGGMGEVWRARHQLLARPCAVKLIRPDRLGASHRDAALERFRREARTIARLTSPNTVRLYDFGLSESGSLYFVMELLRGLDLFALVRDFGPAPARARRLRAAAGLPLARRGARRGAPAPGRQAAQPLPVPPRPRLRRGQGARLRPRQVARGRGRADHHGGRAHRHAGLHAAGAGGRRPRRRALGHLRARLRGLVDADRADRLLRRPHGHDPPPRAHRPRAAVAGLGPARAGAARADRDGLPREGAGQAPGHGPRAVAEARRGAAREPLDAGARRELVAGESAGPRGGRRRRRTERRALARPDRLK